MLKVVTTHFGILLPVCQSDVAYMKKKLLLDKSDKEIEKVWSGYGAFGDDVSYGYIRDLYNAQNCS